MIGDFIISVASGLAVAILLEWLKDRRTKSIRPVPEKPKRVFTEIRAQVSAHSAGFSIYRISGSVIFGFFFSAFTAGIIEAEGRRIEYGSSTMILLMALGTAGFWIFLAGRSRRKKK